jgi:MSHA biogenesis protein MshK
MNAELKSSLFSAVKAACAGVLAALACAPVAAQVPDPTRPPGAQLAPIGAGAGVDNGVIDTERGVQAVLVQPDAKQSSAIVNGQLVKVGGMVGDKRVLKITESEVVLKGPAGREVMKLIPTIEKTPVKMPAKNKRTKVTATSAATSSDKGTSEK